MEKLNIEILPSPHLLRRFMDYVPHPIFEKAERICNLCIQRGKLDLAAKIRKKYPYQYTGNGYDIVSSMGYAICSERDLWRTCPPMP
jgi:hypothetical protein